MADNLKLSALGINFIKREDIRELCAVAVKYADTRNIDQAFRGRHFPESYVFKEQSADRPEVSGKPRTMVKMAFESVKYGQNIFIADGQNYHGNRELMATVIVLRRAIEKGYTPSVKRNTVAPMRTTHLETATASSGCKCGCVL